VGPFPGFSMDTTRARFHAGGKYRLWRTASNTFVRKVIARLGRCLRSLFGIAFGPGVLSTLIPLMAYRTSGCLVIFGSQCEGLLVCAHRLINHLNNCRVQRVVHRLKQPQCCRPGFTLSRSLRELIPPVLVSGDGVGTRILLLSSIATGPHCAKIPANRSTVRSYTRSADRSPTCGGV
jgi:hypothetical protein